MVLTGDVYRCQRVRLGHRFGLDPTEVANHERIKQRGRWRHGAELASTDTVLAAMGSTWVESCPESCELRSARNGSPNGAIVEGFLELDESILNPAPYRIAKFDKWTEEEDIYIREARALLYGMRRAVNTHPDRLRRLLFIVDDMDVCLAFAKGRCRRVDVPVRSTIGVHIPWPRVSCITSRGRRPSGIGPTCLLVFSSLVVQGTVTHLPCAGPPSHRLVVTAQLVISRRISTTLSALSPISIADPWTSKYG